MPVRGKRSAEDRPHEKPAYGVHNLNDGDRIRFTSGGGTQLGTVVACTDKYVVVTTKKLVAFADIVDRPQEAQEANYHIMYAGYYRTEDKAHGPRVEASAYITRSRPLETKEDLLALEKDIAEEHGYVSVALFHLSRL